MMIKKLQNYWCQCIYSIQFQLVSMSPAYQESSLGPYDSEDVELVKKWRGLYPFEYNPNTL